MCPGFVYVKYIATYCLDIFEIESTVSICTVCECHIKWDILSLFQFVGHNTWISTMMKRIEKYESCKLVHCHISIYNIALRYFNWEILYFLCSMWISYGYVYSTRRHWLGCIAGQMHIYLDLYTVYLLTYIAPYTEQWAEQYDIAL